MDFPTPANRAKLGAFAEEVRGLSGGADGWLLCSIAGLCAFGLVMVYSASEVSGILYYNNPNYFFQRQLIGLTVGIVGMVVTMRLDYHRWRHFTKILVLTTVVLLTLVAIPHVGTEVNGARRWFILGPISLQPSTLACLVAIIGFSRWLSDRGPAVRTWRGVRDYGVLVVVLLGLIMLEQDLSTTLITAGLALALLYLAGARLHHLALSSSLLALTAFLGVQMESYRVARLLHFGDPFADPLNTGWQPVQALYALGSGGVTGVGLGNSIEKYQWLSEAHTDFIFAIVGEELGLVGTFSLVAAFLFLLWRGFRVTRRAPDTYGVLLAGGVTAWIGIQAFMNIAAVTHLIPTAGIPLPFISYGGTSIAVTLVALGILCNISAQGRRQGELRRAYVDRWGRDGRTSDPRPRRRPSLTSRRSQR